LHISKTSQKHGPRKEKLNRSCKSKRGPGVVARWELGRGERLVFPTHFLCRSIIISFWLKTEALCLEKKQRERERVREREFRLGARVQTNTRTHTHKTTLQPHAAEKN
jgi:hypothetical protein